MAACNGREPELRWIAERDALRHECYLELKHKLLDVAQAQWITLNQNRKTLQEVLEDETLLDLRQKLDAIALCGSKLSQVFMDSLVATSVHRIASAAIQSRKKPTNGIATEESRANWDNNADSHPTSGCDLAISSAQPPMVTYQAPHRSPDPTSRHSPHSHVSKVVGEEGARAQVAGGAGPALKGFLVDHVLKQPIKDITRGYSAKTPLPRLVQERVDLDRQVHEQRNFLAKRSAYLGECRVAAEKEKEMAGKELATAMLSLVMAEKERAFAANCRAAALNELKHMTSLRVQDQPQGICRPDLGLQDMKAPEKTLECAPMVSAEALRVHLGTFPSISTPLSTCPAIPTVTPPDLPDNTESDGHTGYSCSTNAVTSGLETICPKVATELDGNFDEGQKSTNISHANAKDEAVTSAGTWENPIGPYIRPPMPLEDMLKCVRCLFGKDKSLKTGNRARAFLGIPWSQIVSFDPDVLLTRGVLGIKPGSTGMASRLRMMTIIESALANQNDDVRCRI